MGSPWAPHGLQWSPHGSKVKSQKSKAKSQKSKVKGPPWDPRDPRDPWDPWDPWGFTFRAWPEREKLDQLVAALTPQIRKILYKPYKNHANTC